MFPDICPAFVRQERERIIHGDAVNMLCNTVLETPGYPKKEVQTMSAKVAKEEVCLWRMQMSCCGYMMCSGVTADFMLRLCDVFCGECWCLFAVMWRVLWWMLMSCCGYMMCCVVNADFMLQLGDVFCGECRCHVTVTWRVLWWMQMSCCSYMTCSVVNADVMLRLHDVFYGECHLSMFLKSQLQ